MHRNKPSNDLYGDALLDRMAIEVSQAKSYADAAKERNETINAEGGYVLNDIAAIYGIAIDKIHTYPTNGGTVIDGHTYLYVNGGSVELWTANTTNAPVKPDTDTFSLVPSITRGGTLLTKEVSGSWDITIDVAGGSVQTHTMLKPSVTIEFENIPKTVGNSVEVTLLLKQGLGSGEARWPEGIRWQNGRAPVLSYEKDSVNIIQFVFVNGEQSPYGYFSAGWM